jgi:ketosteroid isomerase-like protein
MSNEDVTPMQTLLDKLAIREVLERYMRYNDDRAADLIAELFDEDAIFQVVGQLVKGREAIRVFFGGDGEQPKPWTEPGELLKQPASVHLSSNPVIDVDGDTATSELDFFVVSRGDDGRARSSLVGRYRDHLRRLDDGRWVITTRVGVSVARPGNAGTDTEWQQILAGLPPTERAAFLT